MKPCICGSTQVTIVQTTHATTRQPVYQPFCEQCQLLGSPQLSKTEAINRWDNRPTTISNVTKPTPEDLDSALNLQMVGEYKDLTIKGFLKKLLETIVEEGESFSGKRPFGNSGWDYDIYQPLIKANYIKGELDEDGYIEDVDDQEANRFVQKLINHIFTKGESNG